MTREFSRNIKSKGIIISETTSWGWHGIKQPSGKHNTINILLTRGARVLGEYSVEVAVQTVNLLLSGSGGSTPHSPIIQSVNIGYEEAVRDVRNSRLVDCRYKYAENPHKAG